MSTMFDQRAEAPMIQVHRIWTQFEPDPIDAGTLREVDMVAYGPVGSKERSVTIDRISRLSKLQSADKAQDNPAIAIAHYRWKIIKQHYEAFKAGKEATLDGTPISAWNAISPEQAEVLKLNGIHTVEQVANLTDTHVMRFGIPGLQKLVPAALGFIKGSDNARTSAELAKKDEEIAALKSQMEDLAEMVRASMAAQARVPEPETAVEPAQTTRRTGRA